MSVMWGLEPLIKVLENMMAHFGTYCNLIFFVPQFPHNKKRLIILLLTSCFSRMM